jgi:hypothetical protein
LTSAPPELPPPQNGQLARWLVALVLLLAALGAATWIAQDRGLIHLYWPSWLTR